jgi:hypothetical protein
MAEWRVEQATEEGWKAQQATVEVLLVEGKARAEMQRPLEMQV